MTPTSLYLFIDFVLLSVIAISYHRRLPSICSFASSNVQSIMFTCTDLKTTRLNAACISTVHDTIDQSIMFTCTDLKTTRLNAAWIYTYIIFFYQAKILTKILTMAMNIYDANQYDENIYDHLCDNKI